MILSQRILCLKEGPDGRRNVVYWMSRDQRAAHNWGLLYARELAEKNASSMAVVFCLAPSFQGAYLRQYHFMLKGLEETAAELADLNIPFYLLFGNPPRELQRFVQSKDVGSVVCDFDPLRIKQEWIQAFIKHTDAGLYELDSHNIVPTRHASQKTEFGAYTLRPKLKKLLPLFLSPFPLLSPQADAGVFEHVPFHYDEIMQRLNPDTSVKPVDWLVPGAKAAEGVLSRFLGKKLEGYANRRNDPNLDGLSNLSPYLHFGQISAQHIVLRTLSQAAPGADRDAFLEELIVRRELADNYCLYNNQYDSLENIPAWAKQSLAEHAGDEREHYYTRHEFEAAQTSDPLWNAAQLEMVKSGKMHGYMRMYWAKKILEWTASPDEALQTAIYLNDKYQLDGRDPNGYTGCAWSVAGVHDRPWARRPVFGKIRYMNFNGAKRKFDVEAYIRRWLTDPDNSGPQKSLF